MDTRLRMVAETLASTVNIERILAGNAGIPARTPWRRLGTLVGCTWMTVGSMFRDLWLHFMVFTPTWCKVRRQMVEWLQQELCRGPRFVVQCPWRQPLFLAVILSQTLASLRGRPFAPSAVSVRGFIHPALEPILRPSAPLPAQEAALVLLYSISFNGVMTRTSPDIARADAGDAKEPAAIVYLLFGTGWEYVGKTRHRRKGGGLGLAHRVLEHFALARHGDRASQAPRHRQLRRHGASTALTLPLWSGPESRALAVETLLTRVGRPRANGHGEWLAITQAPRRSVPPSRRGRPPKWLRRRDVTMMVSQGAPSPSLWDGGVWRASTRLLEAQQREVSRESTMTFADLYRLRQRQSVAAGAGQGPVALLARRETLLRVKWAASKRGGAWVYPRSWTYSRAARDFVRGWRLLDALEAHEKLRGRSRLRLMANRMRLPPPTRRTLIFRTSQERTCLVRRIRCLSAYYGRFAPILGPWTMSRFSLRSGSWPGWGK